MTTETLQRQTYSVEEAAQILNISRSFAYELAASGELPGVRKLGHRYIVVKPVFDAWLAGVA
jgi:excisionase family DNA binding protein